MKIILDVMSGDNAPAELLRGAEWAAREYPVTICVVGDEKLLLEIANKENIDLKLLQIVHADSVIHMEDKPLSVVREKKDSSMAVGLRMLAEGDGDAFVSAGNTGALLAGATLMVRRIRGIGRAGIATVLPFPTPTLLLDAGANLEITEENMEQFAVMGSIYMQKLYGIENPRVGQVNNGTEYNKGLALQVASFERLSHANINFVGNIEAKEIPFGACDVLVTDGFTGNIVLKLVEGMGKFMMKTLKELFYANTVTKISGALVKPKLAGIKKKYDASEHGGAPFLGISKPVIKAHGSSDAKAVKNAVWQAMQFVSNGVNLEIAKAAEEWHKAREAKAECAESTSDESKK